MARRRHLIRNLLQLPEARYNPIRDTEHQTETFGRDISQRPRKRLHRVQRHGGRAEAVIRAVQGARQLEVMSVVSTNISPRPEFLRA